MKKILKALFLGFAFTATTVFMSCADTISENEEAQVVEQIAEETTSDSSRHCFGGHNGRDTNGRISSCGHRRNGHGHGSSVCK